MTLREQVAKEIYESVFIGDWWNAGEAEQACYLQAADAVLALLNGPNFRIVQRDRWDRVRRGAQHARDACLSKHDGWMCNYPEIDPADYDEAGTSGQWPLD